VLYAPPGTATYEKRYDLAQTMQWIGWLGVLRMVQTGNVLGTGFVTQSKHSVVSRRIG
jgi:hypothetical protein